MFSFTIKAQQSVKGGPGTEAFKSQWMVAKRSAVALQRYRYFTHYELRGFFFFYEKASRVSSQPDFFTVKRIGCNHQEWYKMTREDLMIFFLKTPRSLSEANSRVIAVWGCPQEEGCKRDICPPSLKWSENQVFDLPLMNKGRASANLVPISALIHIELGV